MANGLHGVRNKTAGVKEKTYFAQWRKVSPKTNSLLQYKILQTIAVDVIQN